MLVLLFLMGCSGPINAGRNEISGAYENVGGQKTNTAISNDGSDSESETEIVEKEETKEQIGTTSGEDESILPENGEDIDNNTDAKVEVVENEPSETEVSADDVVVTNEDINNNEAHENEIVSTENLVIPSFNLSVVPAYSGSPYAIVNGNKPYFSDSELVTTPFEYYSELDSLGRCGITYANICAEIMPTEARGEIGMIKPSGWKTIKYDFVDGKYLYNRCHLIGYQLSGENDNVNNLITGTRYLNVQGMLPLENQVANYVKKTDNHVLYRVTPIFEGNNLLAAGVLMEAKSVEDKGEGISFCVFCYNVQPGVVINYVDGSSYSDGSEEVVENGNTETTKNTGTNHTEVETITNPVPEDCTYVLNNNTKRFHYPYCSSVNDMAEHNKQYVNWDRETIMDKEYRPCGRCNP